jgi:hypothetical protein
MAIEKNVFLKANQGVPAADIPDLKKKGKERKKGGAAWSGSNGGAGSPFMGATGGTVAQAAASAAIGAAEAGEAGGIFATVSEFLTGLTATLAGKLALGAAALLFMIGAVAFGRSLLRGGPSDAAGPDLGPITDSVRIRTGDGDMLGVGGNGELAFGAPKAAARGAKLNVAAAAKDAAPQDQKAATDADGHAGDAAWTPPNLLAHNMNGDKLSNAIGGGAGGGGGFSASADGVAAKLNTAMSQLSGAKAPGAAKGNLNAMAMKSTRGGISAMDLNRAKSTQAIAQLKMARGMSVLGAASLSVEGASSAANDAFDQQDTNGGGLNMIAPDGIPNAGSGPTGAPDTTSMPTVSTPPGTEADPNLQNEMSQIQQMAQEAAKLEALGMLLIAIGISLLGNPFTAPIGAALIAIGIMLEMMAAQLAAEANALGQQVAQQVGPYQGTIVNQCTQQSLQGQSNCTPAETQSIQQQQEPLDAAAVQTASQVGTATPQLDNGNVSTGGGSVSGTGGASNH